jgi:outer membrane protein
MVLNTTNCGGRGWRLRWRPLVPAAVPLAVAALAWLGGASAQAQPLPELLAQALAADPSVASARAQLRAAQERVTQARAAFGPTAGLSANAADNRYNEAPSYDLRQFRSQQLALQITQPVLRAALVPAFDSAQAQQQQAEAALAQAQADGAQRLVESLFELLKARDTLAFSRAQQAAAGEQRVAARRSFDVGTVAITDVRDAEAKADNLAAQVQANEAELVLRQQVLAELAGQPAPAWQSRGLDGQRLPALPASSVLDWLAEATTNSPQLEQARQALASAEAEVRKAWLGHSPTADLTYNYTMSKDTGTTVSIFPRRGDTSTIGVNVNIPLFASGATQSKVREAIAQRDKAQADVDVARRTVTLGVRQAFSAALGAIAQAHGLQAAVRSQEVALRANRRGYEIGMKVNAEVLDAQGKLFEARRDLSRARYDAWFNLIKLKALSGRLQQSDVIELEAAMVPVAAEPALDVAAPRRPAAQQP